MIGMCFSLEKMTPGLMMKTRYHFECINMTTEDAEEIGQFLLIEFKYCVLIDSF